LNGFARFSTAGPEVREPAETSAVLKRPAATEAVGMLRNMTALRARRPADASVAGHLLLLRYGGRRQSATCRAYQICRDKGVSSPHVVGFLFLGSKILISTKEIHESNNRIRGRPKIKRRHSGAPPHIGYRRCAYPYPISGKLEIGNGEPGSIATP